MSNTNRLYLSMFSLGLLWVVSTSAVTQQREAATDQRPVEKSPIIVDYASPPDSLEGLGALSDAVIVGRVSRHRTKEAHTPGAGRTELKTDFVIHIGEVLKSHPQLPSTGSDVTIERLGGRVDEGDRLRESFEEEFRLFSQGDIYLLFLRLNPVTYAFEVRSGPHGAYRISNGTIQSLGRSRVAERQNGKNADIVLAGLRSALVR